MKEKKKEDVRADMKDNITLDRLKNEYQDFWGVVNLFFILHFSGMGVVFCQLLYLLHVRRQICLN